MKPTVLIDTNVWVSALINPSGLPASIEKEWIEHRFNVVVSPYMLEELIEVLTRPRIKEKYHLTSAEIARFIRLINESSIKVIPSGNMHICRDAFDDIVLETAILGKAKYLVTRDDDIKRDINLFRHMKEHGIEILSVSQFLKIISQSNSI